MAELAHRSSPTDQGPAEWWPRAGAALLDLVIAGSIALLAGIPFGIFDSSSDECSGGWFLVAIALCTAYYWLTMRRDGAYNGQTLGKQAIGLRVVRDDGQPVRLGLVLLRELLLKFLVGW